MKNTLDIYSELNSFFDIRRGIITHLARENGFLDFKWEQFDSIYQKRKMDYFNRPSIGITPEGYAERYDRRSIDDWADSNECYFYPTNLASEMFQLVRGIEFGSTQTIMVEKMNLTINCFPFILSNELKAELIVSLQSTFKFPVGIKIVYLPYEKLTAPYLNMFDYVFKYDLLIDKNSKAWFETVGELNRYGTKYIVPDLLAKNYNPESAGVLKTVNVDDHIRKCSAVLGGSVIFIPAKRMAEMEMELTAANSKLAELKGLCLEHLRHYDSCAKRVKFSNKCSCGLDAAIKKVREMSYACSGGSRIS